MENDEINKVENGARFYRVDLHIHTPGSLDYKDKASTPQQIVRKAVESKLDLIAVTDHNSIDECYNVIKAAKSSKLVVLPGVEISALGGEQGIHVLAIFDCNTSKNKILDMLARIGLGSDQRGKQEALTDLALSNVVDEIQKAKGIAIAAHADQNKGLVNDLRGQQRIAIVRNEKLSGIEIFERETRKFFDGKDENYKRKIPCIQGSDAHSLSEIGRRVTRLKMEKPCLEGIRQAFLDQESRIRFDDEPILRPYPYIVGMSVKGGFVGNQVIRFNKNLNCLIGGRGTGKSTIIELLRFCLDALPRSKTFQDRRLEMIKYVLGEGEVTVFIQTKEETTYKIQRKFGEEPHVFTIENKETDVKPVSLFPMVGYGETEIEQISYDVSSQLDLIDKFSEGLDEPKRTENELRQKLQANTDLVLNDQRIVSGIEQKLIDFPSVNEKLRELQKHDFDKRLEKQRKRVEEKSHIEKIKDACSDLSDEITGSTLVKDLSQILDELPSDDMIEQMPNKKLLKNAINQFKKLHAYISKNSEYEKNYIQKIIEKIEKISAELQRRHEIQEKTTLKLFEKLEAEGVKDAAQSYLDLQKKKRELEKLRSKVFKLKRHLGKLESQRTELLKKLEQTRQKIFKIRQQCANLLSERLGPRISIEIEKGGNIEEYCNVLREALKGSRVYSEYIENIVKSISPFEFFSIVKEKRVNDLTKKIDITDHWAEVIVNFEPLREKLYEIQQVFLPDMPRIFLEVGGEKRRLDSISLGQRCTTLLSLAMLESELPLIVDTPEEGLDNIFVFDSVVKNLRDIKERRQLIFATHNANIPVSGDAELIICLESDGQKGWVSCRGSIDEEEVKERVQHVLEGGKEAFMIRKRKYGY